MLKNTRSTVIAGGPHAIIWTHANEVNQALLDFIGHPAGPAHGRADRRTRRRAGRRTDGPADPGCDRASRSGFPTEQARSGRCTTAN